ncbi:ATP-binding protein [Sinosporangium siamense]|uniref:HTH luxR-type domain-containing protein n=1 Tax=Sinosporangium siamense TaxID=1367973 RepID=A0A919RHK3_9ACTN|nr:LuxR family transcriptional regulator [Sinosporangium siamense]GII93973.1 hypothetical protein Ssi02_42040 [Sinosporangium siamense]
MRGRDHEWRTVLGLLRAARSGRGGALLLDGETGAGKSRILAEAAAKAAGQGFAVAAGQAEELGELVPMAPLFTALGEPPPTPAETDLTLVERLRTRAEALAARRPLVVALDDLQWAGPATLTAVRTLRARLTPYPVVWLLARGTTGRSPGAERLFATLEAEGAVRLELRPLPPGAAAGLTADLLPAPPGLDLLKLAAGACGNPLLLTELVTGLREERGVRVAGGAAHLVAERLPRRLLTLVARRLDRLSGQARGVAEIAAVLGAPFSPEDVAGALGGTPAALLPALDEAMDAGLLTTGGGGLVFRHDLVRRAVLEVMPVPVRQALHHQICGPPPGRYGPAKEAASPYDPPGGGLAGEAASHEWGGTAGQADPHHQTGGLPHGRAGPAAEAAPLHPPPGAPGDGARAGEPAEGLPDGDGATPVAGLVLLSAARWDTGHLDEGLRTAREAVSRADEGTQEARSLHPRLNLASMLLDLHRLDEAETVLRTAREEVDRPENQAWAAGPAVLSARLDLARHRPADAVTAAETALAAADASGARLFTSLGAAVLGAAALRRGDPQTAAACTDTVGHTPLPDHAATHGRARCLLIAAQAAEALGNRRRAATLTCDLCSALDRLPSPLVVEPTAAAWLVRHALGAGDHHRAETVAAATDRLARDNPGHPLLLAAAAHTRGLLTGDASALTGAAAQYPDEHARASAREDLGALLARRGDRDGAVGALDDALLGYEATGAVRDAARTRRRLRRLGVRHRHWTRGRPSALGWDGLTATQRLVAHLVARGLTNRQVADQMYISVHTVAFHLRQIFRKLDIDSRVDLARLAVEEHHRPTEQG